MATWKWNISVKHFLHSNTFQSGFCIISLMYILSKSIIWSNLFTGNVNEMYFLIEIFLTESFVAEYICSIWLCNLGEMYNKIKYIKFFSSKNWIQLSFFCLWEKPSSSHRFSKFNWAWSDFAVWVGIHWAAALWDDLR